MQLLLAVTVLASALCLFAPDTVRGHSERSEASSRDRVRRQIFSPVQSMVLNPFRMPFGQGGGFMGGAAGPPNQFMGAPFQQGGGGGARGPDRTPGFQDAGRAMWGSGGGMPGGGMMGPGFFGGMGMGGMGMGGLGGMGLGGMGLGGMGLGGMGPGGVGLGPMGAGPRGPGPMGPGAMGPGAAQGMWGGGPGVPPPRRPSGAGAMGPGGMGPGAMGPGVSGAGPDPRGGRGMGFGGFMPGMGSQVMMNSPMGLGGFGAVNPMVGGFGRFLG